MGQDVTAFILIQWLGQVCLPTLERMATQLSGLDTQCMDVLHVAYPSGPALWQALQTHPKELLWVDLRDRLEEEIWACRSAPWPAPLVSGVRLFTNLERARAIKIKCLLHQNALPTAVRNSDWWQARAYHKAIEDV